MDQGSDVLSDFFDESADDIFSLLESLDDFQTPNESTTPLAAAAGIQLHEAEGDPSSLQRTRKRQEVSATAASAYESSDDGQQQQPQSCHIAVERKRRKQMNDNLSTLRTLMPAFYVKRGDQASIIEAVVDYINELQHILQSLEAKKQRKVYSSDNNNTPSPRMLSSPRKPLMSPRLSLPPISPRTPQPNTTTSSPYKPTSHCTSPRLLLPSASSGFLFPTPIASPPASPLTCPTDSGNKVAGKSKSAIADVEVKFSGSNVILKTVSPCIPGQALKIISALDDLALEILHVSISTINDATSLYSYTIKIGIECQLSAEELAQQIQQTFC